MIRYAVLSVHWVSSLAVAMAMARQDQPPVSPRQELAESILSGQQVISGNDIGFRVTSVRNRGTAVRRADGRATDGSRQRRVAGSDTRVDTTSHSRALTANGRRNLLYSEEVE